MANHSCKTAAPLQSSTASLPSSKPHILILMTHFRGQLFIESVNYFYPVPGGRNMLSFSCFCMSRDPNQSDSSLSQVGISGHQFDFLMPVSLSTKGAAFSLCHCNLHIVHLHHPLLPFGKSYPSAFGFLILLQPL